MNRRQTISIISFTAVHEMKLPLMQHQLVFFYQGNGLLVQFSVQPMNGLLFWKNAIKWGPRLWGSWDYCFGNSITMHI